MVKRRSINESTLISGGYGFVGGGGYDNTLSPASYNVQGKQPGYVYSILPMTDTLQQKPNKIEHEYYIHPGCTVRGVGYNNKFVIDNKEPRQIFDELKKESLNI